MSFANNNNKRKSSVCTREIKKCIVEWLNVFYVAERVLTLESLVDSMLYHMTEAQALGI